MQRFSEWINTNGHENKVFNLHPAQRDIMASDRQYVAFIGGTGSGKTALGGAWMLAEVAKDPTANYLIVSPTFNILESATFPSWLAAVSGTPYEGSYKVGSRQYLLPQGGVIYCRSAEHSNSFQGIHVKGIWFDEAGMSPVAVWHVLKQRTGYHQGRIYLGSTPYPEHVWLKNEILDSYLAGNDRLYVRQCTSIENPNYSRLEYEEAKKTLPAWKFKMLYQAEFSGVSGLVYPELETCLVDMTREDLPFGRVFGGIDFGGGSATSDPFASLLGILDEHDCLYLIWERYKKECDVLQNAEHLNNISELMKELGQPVERWFADASRPDFIRALRRNYGLPLRKSNNTGGSIAMGIDCVTRRIRLGKLKILRKQCTGLVHESSLYRYPENDNGDACGSIPVDRNNHAMDALRYLIHGIDRKVSAIHRYDDNGDVILDEK